MMQTKPNWPTKDFLALLNENDTLNLKLHFYCQAYLFEIYYPEIPNKILLHDAMDFCSGKFQSITDLSEKTM